DTMVRIFSFLESMSQEWAFFGTPSGSQVRGEAHILAQAEAHGVQGLGAQPVAATPHPEILHCSAYCN
ncbi:hypothetical protein HAX54_029647, partial [Datura stramonium]|nr:hypothetical protein [Datura stramonium]